MKAKICTKCGDEYPATSEYFSFDKRVKDGLQSQCRECCKEKDRKYYQQYPSKRKKAVRKWRQTIAGHLWVVYNDMKRRCNNPNNKDYKQYGGRGIKVLFKSLNDFRNYVISILKVDPRGLQIDRINNDGNYERGNIRFVTAKENCNNRRQRGSY